MGERRALVIASQCEGLNWLEFLPDAAHEVEKVLLDPSIGGCVPALPDTALLVDPTVDELDAAVTEAFARASEDEATLFIALVGHGDYTYDDFYFLVRETTLPPTSRTAFLLAQRVRELLAQHSLLDGLVLLLDTCHSGIAAQQAGHRWIQIVGQAGRRFEVLTASDYGVAADGCFSRQLVRVLRSGHPDLGERLRCPDLKAVLSGLCPMQTAVHLAFDGRREIAAGDEGLWLARNTSDAWRSSRAADNPAADLIDRLTRDFTPSQDLRTLVGHVMMGARTIAVTGPAGSGKSQLIAALARPSVAPEFIPPKLMDAVVFLSATDTVEHVAVELARQLSRNTPGFAEAARAFEDSADRAFWEASDAFERAVAGPLRTSRASVRIAVDGIDHVSFPVRTRLRRALTDLPTAQVVVSSREMVQAQGYVSLRPAIDVSPVIAPGAGSPMGHEIRGDNENAEAADPLLLDLLHATGKARVPTAVLVRAAGRPISVVRDFLVGQDVVRLSPGTPQETVAMTADGTPGSREAHSAIADALLHLAPVADRKSGTPEQIYADAALAEHLWQADRPEEALECLENRGSSVPADNRAVWEAWSERIGFAKGRESRLGIVAKARHLTALGKTGHRAEALSAFRELLSLAESALPSEDPEILSIRNNIGYLLLELQQFEEAEQRLRELVEDTVVLLGPAHRETLHARHLHAVVIGKRGDSAKSARLSAELIPEAEAALGPDDEVTINARLNYHFHTRESGNPPPRCFSGTDSASPNTWRG